jgi:hypothetical protein
MGERPPAATTRALLQQRDDFGVGSRLELFVPLADAAEVGRVAAQITSSASGATSAQVSGAPTGAAATTLRGPRLPIDATAARMVAPSRASSSTTYHRAAAERHGRAAAAKGTRPPLELAALLRKDRRDRRASARPS